MPSTTAQPRIGQFRRKRVWLSAPLACGISFALLLALVGSMAGHSTVYPQAMPGQQAPTTPTSIPIGGPCGRTERLSPSAYCVHGAVLNEGGRPFDGVTVTVATEEGSVTGRTSVHPGQRYGSPSYGLDISGLYPTFLEAVVVTATDGSAITVREMPALPDWISHDQRFDLRLPSQQPANLTIFGYVYDYTSGQIVVGAVVTATSAGASTPAVATTDRIAPFDPNPVYTFSRDVLGITAATTDTTEITLTVEYSGMTLSRSVMVEPAGVEQVNLLVGWPCDGSDVLPRSGGSGFGLPRSGGSGFGLPDDSCVWGVVAVDGEPSAGVDVYITTADGVLHQGVTATGKGEITPKYAIRIPNASNLIGRPMRIDVAQGGFTHSVTETLGEAPSQRVDLQFVTVEGLGNINENDPFEVYWVDPYLWIARRTYYDGSGRPDFEMVRYTPISGTIAAVQANVIYTSIHGLSPLSMGHNGNIALQEDTGLLWFTDQGASLYAPFLDPRFKDPAAFPYPGAWITLTPGQDMPVASTQFGGAEIVFDDMGGAWVTNGGEGVSYVTPRIDGATGTLTITSRLYTTTTSEIVDGIHWGMAQGKRVFWLAARGGVTRIDRLAGSMKSLTSQQVGMSQSAKYGPEMELTSSDSLWIRSDEARDNLGSVVSRITPALQVYSIYSGCPGVLADASKLLCTGSAFRDILPGVADDVWILMDTGIVHVSDLLTPTVLLTSTLGLDAQIRSVEVDANGNLWVAANNVVSRIDAVTLDFKTFSAKDLGLQNIDFGYYPAGPLLDTEGNAWLSDGDSLVRIDAANPNVVMHFSAESLWPPATSHGTIGATFDREGNLWLHQHGTSVTKIDIHSWAVIQYPTEQLGLSGSVQQIVADMQGGLWVLANCDGRVSHWTPITGTWKAITVSREGVYIDNGCHISTYGSPYLWYRRNVVDDFSGTLEQAIERPQDLSVELSGPRQAFAGRRVSYTMVVKNEGERWVQPTVTLTLPAGSLLAGSDLTPVGQSPGGPVLWALETLTPSTGVVTVTADVIMPDSVGASVTALAAVVGAADEGILLNNSASWNATLGDPRPNLRLALAGPPLAQDGQPVTYTIWVENAGGTEVSGGQLTVAGTTYTLPPLGVKASPTGTITVTLVLQPNYAGDGYGTINAAVTPPPGIAESDTSDNQAQTVTAAERIAGQLETLFIVAGSRMATDPNQGASGVLTSLAKLARNPGVKGAVLDVQQAQAVADAYTTWWASPASRANPDLANKVVETIRSEIQAFLGVHPNIRYLVFVGGDDIIPFYRVRDASNTHWKESTFARDLSPSTVRDALGADYFLTDDYYTDDQPEAPFSKFWPDARPIFVPDRISSRLVETPDEIQATISAFLTASSHTISLAPGIVGGDRKLTLDTAGHICRMFESSVEPGPFCTVEEPIFANVLTDSASRWNSAWTAFHANQMVNGEVTAAEIGSMQSSFDQRLWVSIGCHSGLNLPESVGSPNELDLVQSFVGKGGVAIAPTAYGYASKRKEPAYSELFMLALAERMLACSGQTVGAAFIQAKHRFFAEQAGWLDPLDEKAVLPVTLYGLPHWQVLSSAQICPQSADAALATASAIVPETASSLPTTASAVSSLTFTFTVEPALLQSLNPPLSTGDYYRYDDQTLAQNGRPIQPIHHLAAPETLPDLGSIRGLVLLDATYHDLQDFDPVIEQAWIISAMQQQSDEEEVEPPVELSGWDHDYPHSLGFYPKRAGADDSNPVARINLVLGACNAETLLQQEPQVNCSQERLFDSIKLDALYSTSDDVTAPHLVQVSPFRIVGVPGLSAMYGASVVADEALHTAVLVCDDGQGHYATVGLANNGGWWSGNCPGLTERLFVQAVDTAGNVTASEWLVPLLVVLNNYTYLGQIMNDFSPLLPDLIATDVSVDQDGEIVATIRNIGRGFVVDDFWVDLCFMNSGVSGVRPPSAYNEVCKGRSHDYLVWSVLASQTPIPPGGELLLTQDTVNVEESVFERVIPADTPIWVHVDSTNVNTLYGGVLEEGEPSSSGYNNILGPVKLKQDLYPSATSGPAGAVLSVLLPVRLDATVPGVQETKPSPAMPNEFFLLLPTIAR